MRGTAPEHAPQMGCNGKACRIREPTGSAQTIEVFEKIRSMGGLIYGDSNGSFNRC